MSKYKIGDRIISRDGPFLAELMWTADGWFTVRSDGPYMSAFTDEERAAFKARERES